MEGMNLIALIAFTGVIALFVLMCVAGWLCDVGANPEPEREGEDDDGPR